MTENAPQPTLEAYLRMLDRVPELFKSSWDAIGIYDVQGNLVAGNAVARKLVGRHLANKLAGQHFSAHMGLDESTAAARIFAHVVTTGEISDGETLFREGDGTPVPVLTRLVPARLDGKIVGVIGFARDVSAQRNYESRFIRVEEQFRSIFEQHPDALTILDLHGRFVRVNAGAVRMTGYPIEELIGMTPAMLTHTGNWDDRDLVMGAILRGETVEFTSVVTTKSGKHKEVNARAVPIAIGADVRAFYLIGRDVTEARARDRESARDTQRIVDLYRIAASTAPAEEKISLTLAAGIRELHADWAYVGHIEDGVMTLTHTDGIGIGAFPVGRTIDLERAVVRHAIAANDLFVAEDLREPRWKDDIAGTRAVWRSFVGMPLTVDGHVEGAVGFTTSRHTLHLSETDREYVRALSALTASAAAQLAREKHLDTLAFHDPLSGLPNRSLLHDRLEQTLLSARRHRRSMAVHYIDIDHFKSVNDTYGHQTGDGVLIAVGQWLRATLRESDTIARIGGDEFVVLQPEIASSVQARELAERLVAINTAVFRVGARDFTVTVSVGSAVFPADAENPVDLLRSADAALYSVKERGRNGFSLVTVG